MRRLEPERHGRRPGEDADQTGSSRRFDCGRGVSREALHVAGEVRLVGVAELVRDIRDRLAGAQLRGGLASAGDLPDLSRAPPGDAREVALDRARRHGRTLAVKRRLDDGVVGEEAVRVELGEEVVDRRVVGHRPDEIGELEVPGVGHRQRHGAVEHRARLDMGEVRALRESHAHVAVARPVGHRRGLGRGAAEQHARPIWHAREDHVPAGVGRRQVGAVARVDGVPDHVDEGGGRGFLLVEEAHAAECTADL